MTKKKGQVRRCEARYLSRSDQDRCILPFGPNGHDLARSNRGELALPVLIHQDPEGREWTIHGPFTREQRKDSHVG